MRKTLSADALNAIISFHPPLKAIIVLNKTHPDGSGTGSRRPTRTTTAGWTSRRCGTCWRWWTWTWMSTTLTASSPWVAWDVNGNIPVIHLSLQALLKGTIGNYLCWNTVLPQLALFTKWFIGLRVVVFFFIGLKLTFEVLWNRDSETRSPVKSDLYTKLRWAKKVPKTLFFYDKFWIVAFSSSFKVNVEGGRGIFLFTLPN